MAMHCLRKGEKVGSGRLLDGREWNECLEGHAKDASGGADDEGDRRYEESR
jgi:hypothetical protein